MRATFIIMSAALARGEAGGNLLFRQLVKLLDEPLEHDAPSNEWPPSRLETG